MKGNEWTEMVGIGRGLLTELVSKYENWPRRHATLLISKHVNLKKIEQGKVDFDALVSLAKDIVRVVENAYNEGYDAGFDEGEAEGKKGGRR